MEAVRSRNYEKNVPTS